MHLGKFHRAIHLLVQDYEQSATAEKLKALIDQLTAVAANPGNDDVMKGYKDRLESLRTALSGSTLNRPFPTLRKILEEIGATKFVGDEFFDEVRTVIDNNRLLPQSAAGALTKLRSKLENFYLKVRQIDEAFSELAVEYVNLDDGETELGISIPVEHKSKTLLDLSLVAKSWHKNLAPFVEVFSDDNEPIKLDIMSSSDWQFYLTTSMAVMGGISLAMSGVNDILRKLVETRKLIKSLRDAGTSADAVAAVERDADTRLDKSLKEAATKIVAENYKKDDAGRKNELEIAMANSLKFIAKQISENVTIEVRLELPLPPKEIEGEQSPEAVQELERQKAEYARLQQLHNQFQQATNSLPALDGEDVQLLALEVGDEPADETV